MKRLSNSWRCFQNNIKQRKIKKEFKRQLKNNTIVYLIFFGINIFPCSWSRFILFSAADRYRILVSFSTRLSPGIYIYIYMYVCRQVCICEWILFYSEFILDSWSPTRVAPSGHDPDPPSVCFTFVDLHNSSFPAQPFNWCSIISWNLRRV